MKRIGMNNSLTLEDAFKNFLFSKNSEGLSEKTIASYKGHLKIIANDLDTSMLLSDLTKEDFQVVIDKMRKRRLAQNTIASYVRIFRTFLSWARTENLTDVYIPMYKTEETIKETYTDEELLKLLKKPNINKCKFSEYRNWVIVNFLLNSGARAATIRSIQIQDVDLENNIVLYRHTKNKKSQVIPLCSSMVIILKEYLYYREGAANDYLFCKEDGDQMSDDALKSAIRRYNKRRGVHKSSIHLFRHTYAKKYLLDCDGNAFSLQRLLGHSTLEMTRHYCNIYNVDLVKNYDDFSPLQKLNSKEKKISLKKERCN